VESNPERMSSSLDKCRLGCAE